jgi:TatD DNase family protein
MPQYDYIDIHSHLNFDDFATDRDEIIARMKTEKIATITVGTTVADSRDAIALAEKHENLFATVGIHPNHPWTEADFAELEVLASHSKVVAVGECGLDFFRLPKGASASEIEKIKIDQGLAFARHIELALAHDKPLMLHCRAAYDEVLSVLESFKTNHELGSRLRGNAHFFAGTLAQAKRFIALDFSISFDGPITFARDYDEVIKNVPLTSLMAETDSPYAAPVPFRGKRSEPLHVKEVVKAIADIRGEDSEVVRVSMVQNAVRAFGLK